jgi:hypothetical protein
VLGGIDQRQFMIGFDVYRKMEKTIVSSSHHISCICSRDRSKKSPSILMSLFSSCCYGIAVVNPWAGSFSSTSTRKASWIE